MNIERNYDDSYNRTTASGMISKPKILYKTVISRAQGEACIKLLDQLRRYVHVGSLLLSGSTMIQGISPRNNFGPTDLDLYLKSGKIDFIFHKLR